MTVSGDIGSQIDFHADGLPWTRTIPGYSFVFLLLWLSILEFPRFPANELDPSWRMVLSYALNQNLQFGKEIIFTYGPLGFLMGRTYANIHWDSLIIWQLFSAAFFAWIIMRTARHYSPARTFFYYLYFFLLGTIFDEALHGIILVLLGLDLIIEAPRDKKILPLSVSSFLAIISLVKFNDLLLSVLDVGCSCLYDLLCQRYRRAMLVAGAYGITFIGLWTVLGQNPMNIPLYILNSLEISKGYNEAMALEETNRIFNLGLAAILILICYSLLYYVTHPDKLKAAILMSIFGGGLYLSWKHGFVRANEPVVLFFIYSLFPVVAFPTSLKDGERAHNAKSSLLFIAGVTSLVGIYISMPQWITDCLSNLNERIKVNVDSLASLKQLRSIYEERWRTDQAYLNMPRTREEVGSASLDVLGNVQAIALYNRFHYTPRPIFQSYSAYTRRLIEANVHFYNQETAPKYVLQKYQSIDNRFPSLEDARVLNILFRDYAFEFVEKGYLLWKRKLDSTKNVSFAPKLQRQQEVRFNERIELGEVEPGTVWVAVKYKRSFLGTIRALLYKPPPVRISVFNGDTMLGKFRIIGPMAEQGFILSPLIESQFDLLRFIGGQPGRQVTSFSVDVPASHRKFFQSSVEVLLYSLPPLPPSGVKTSDYYGGEFRPFPLSVTSPYSPTPVRIGTADALMVHAPGEMIFEVPPQSTLVSGRFGFVPGAYTDGGNTDGAEFSILWVAHDKTLPLFKQYLDPVNNPKDRGLHLFKLDIPNRETGKLVFRTDPGPKHNAAWDWTAWSDIEIK